MLTDHKPTTPIDAIIFDCDGTLVDIEGIDELAKDNGVGSQVIQLTADAMGHTGMSPELYQKRLDLVLPTLKQVEALANTYFQHKSPDLLAVIDILKTLGKTIYIVSAGLYPAVADFGELIGIDHEHVFAVNIYFDQAGNYLDFDRHSPLVYGDGKQQIVMQLKQQHRNIILIGDGLTDYATHDLVTRFIGYGGAYYRKNIEQLCDYYVTQPSMAALLPFCLTAAEASSLSAEQHK